MQSITVPSVLSPKPHNTTHHCDQYALVGWPSLHTRRQTHWLHVIYKTLQGKVPTYLTSLVTIASPTCSTRSTRSLVTSKTNSFFGWLSCWRILPPSLALSTSCQSSSQITAPVHSSSVNSPSNLPHSHTVFIYFAPFHPSISTCTFIFCTSCHSSV